jgi:hypothetical protein
MKWLFYTGLPVLVSLPVHSLTAANVSINALNNLSTVASTAYGIHTSVYDNQNGNVNLPGRLIESGVNTLRYSGGGYADVYHWSVHKLNPWQDGSYGYIGPSTDFGNFIKLLDNAQAKPVITVNFGSGLQWNAGHTQLIAPGTNATPQEGAAWVAYANATTNVFVYGTVNDQVIGTDVLGYDWKTVGFWAKLRCSTLSQYQAWSGANYNADYNFLAIGHTTPVGIKYWEIGNETFGTGYYDSGGDNGYSVNYAVPYPYTTFTRYSNPSLSPAAYGQRVNDFAQAMKAVDPTIKIGTVVSTPPGDYSWDSYAGQRWTPQVLAQCASNTDFVIAHWYPQVGNNNDGSALLPVVGTTIPFMINGATAGQDSGTSSGLRDWINAYRPTDGSNVQVFITEFGYMGSLTNDNTQGPINALFAADSYASWMEYGVANIDYLEMNKTPFVGDSSSLSRGAVFYAVELLHQAARVGDTIIRATSDTSNLRAHAALRSDGNLGLTLLNENRTNSQTVNVTFANINLSTNGTRYQFGAANFTSSSLVPSSPPTTNSVSGLGNSFSVSVPALTMMVFTIPILPNNTAPVLTAIGDQTVNVGQTVAVTASATDTDSPPQTLTFSLLSAPANATLTIQLNSTNAAFNWRPLVTQADSTNQIVLKVADNGIPSLSSTQSFTVVVNPLTTPSASQVGFNGGQFSLQIDGDTGPDYAIMGSTNLVDWNLLFITNSPAMPFLWTDTNSSGAPMQFYRIKVGPPLP